MWVKDSCTVSIFPPAQHHQRQYSGYRFLGAGRGFCEAHLAEHVVTPGRTQWSQMTKGSNLDLKAQFPATICFCVCLYLSIHKMIQPTRLPCIWCTAPSTFSGGLAINIHSLFSEISSFLTLMSEILVLSLQSDGSVSKEMVELARDSLLLLHPLCIDNKW